ncbi:MAG: hypothetical protein LBS43_07610 [Prevotellaceae bacterium]|jgi:hypothetical protein|nr:hypothetical protein [Prevotellaceae bacterium]
MKIVELLFVALALCLCKNMQAQSLEREVNKTILWNTPQAGNPIIPGFDNAGSERFD